MAQIRWALNINTIIFSHISGDSGRYRILFRYSGNIIIRIMLSTINVFFSKVSKKFNIFSKQT